MRLKLQTRYSLTLLSVIAAAIITLSGSLVFEFTRATNDLSDASRATMERELEARLVARGASIVRLLAENLFNPLYSYDIEQIRELLRNTLAEKDIDSVYLVDDRQYMVHDGSDSIDRFGQLIDTALIRAALQQRKLQKAHFDGHIELAQPLVVGDQALGVVSVTLSKASLKHSAASAHNSLDTIVQSATQRTTISMFALITGLILFGVLVAHRLARGLVQPIRELVALAGRIGDGDYSSEYSVKRQDEIGDLANAFNEMSRSLRRTTEEIRHMAYHDSLTGLPNRLMFRELLTHALPSARRRGGRRRRPRRVAGR